MTCQSALSKSDRPGEGCLWALGRTLALPVAIGVALALPIALLAFNTGRVIFNPPLIRRIAANEFLNTDLTAAWLAWFSADRAQQRAEKLNTLPLAWTSEPDIDLLISQLDLGDWKQIRAEALPNETLTGWISTAVDGFYGWLDSSARWPQISLDLKAVKGQMVSEPGIDAIRLAYKHLRPCTQAEVADFKARLSAVPADDTEGYNPCAFPEPWREAQFNAYVDSLRRVVAKLPDQFEVSRAQTNRPDITGAMPLIIKGQVRSVRRWMQWAWLAPLGLLGVLGMLKRLKDLGRWWGWPLTTGGAVAIILAGSHRWLIPPLMISLLAQAPLPFQQAAVEAGLHLALPVFQPMSIQAGIIGLVGLSLVVGSAINNQKASAA